MKGINRNKQITACYSGQIPKRVQNDKRKMAFTLAEVLIALAIIGIVAALTLVPLVRNYKEKELVNRLKETYSMLSRAHQMAVAEYGDLTGWDLGGNDSAASHIKFVNYYKPFLKISKDCGNSNAKGCFYSGGYKTFTGVTMDSSAASTNRAKIQLANGAAIAFYTLGSCSATACGAFLVDVNGVKPPNKAGIDYFSFTIHPVYGVRPDEPSVKKNCTSWCCAYNNTSDTQNGRLCAKWVIEKGNMDYLRRDISNEW